jgi:predicted alpha-1,2-mannosidase
MKKTSLINLKNGEILTLAILSLFTVACSCKLQKITESKLPYQYVNPFIGASTNVGAAGVYHGLGKTFPGATTPFGMVQVSPNTITGGDNSPGYSYEHTTIEGFAFTQMSGVGWYGDLGNLLVMPTTGKLKTIAGKENSKTIKGYRSRYSKESEKASCGYYSVELTDYKIKVEATAAPHSGLLKFTFPKNEQSRIQIDLARRVGGTSTCQYIEIVDDKHIQGWMKCPPEGGGWGNGEGQADYTVYFYAELSKPMKKTGFWSAVIPDHWARLRDETQSEEYLKQVANASIVYNAKHCEGKHIGFFSEFETREGEEITLKTGVSFVDIKGARANFEKEIAGKKLEEIHGEAIELWNDALSKVKVETTKEEDKILFYTALYHTMIDPRIFTDVDGRYVGGGGKVYTSDRFMKRTIFSGWDVFRAQFPLQTLINPRLVNDELNSLISLAEQSGKEYFERWELLNAYSGCMIGNPALSVLADAYLKGIRDYDVEKAYRYAVNSSNRFSNKDEQGFYGPSFSISNTLEYAYADWCLAQFAQALGKTEDAAYFYKKGNYYRNVFDSSKGWFRPRLDNGEWEPWFEDALISEWYGCTEANPYQQGWFVPHDVPGMVELMSGRDSVLKRLDYFFENTPDNLLWNNYYNHANEPVHHVAYLYNRLQAPWKTQQWTRNICKRAYFNSVEGLVGNEDAGQMSAWYVLSSTGLYPLCPGETRYEITSPVFDRIVYRLPASGNTFTITARQNSPENIYIQSAKLNGETYNQCFIKHEILLKGGVLELEMGPHPNTGWGID